MLIANWESLPTSQPEAPSEPLHLVVASMSSPGQHLSTVAWNMFWRRLKTHCRLKFVTLLDLGKASELLLLGQKLGL